MLKTVSTLGGGGISGSGTTNFVAKWSSSTSIGNGVMYDTGSRIGINTTSPQAALDVVSTGSSGGLVIQNGNPIYRANSTTFNYDINTTQINACGPDVATVGNFNFVVSNSDGSTASTPLQIFYDNSVYANGYFWGNQIESNSIYSYNNVEASSNILALGTGGYVRADSTYMWSGNPGGGANTSVGALTNLQSITTGVSNSAFGATTLLNVTSGNANSGFGLGALNAVNTGSSNTGVGVNAANSLSTGNNVTAIGINALGTISTNGNSTAVGATAGLYATGANNTFIGYQSGQQVTTGANSVYLGSYNGNFGGVDLRTSSNVIALSDGAGNLQQWYSGAWIWRVSTTEQMRLTSTGLGIGTSSPGAKLDVNGNVNVRTGYKVFADTYANYTGVSTPLTIQANGSVPVTFETGGSERMRLDSSGNLGIGTSSLVNSGGYATISINGSTGGQIAFMTAGTAKQYIYSTSTDITYYNANGAQIWYGVGGEAMRLDSSRNLGIGTSSPSASAIVDAQSTSKGVRFPNMTTTQKNAISSPSAGLVVFDTTLAKLCVYSGSAWQTITSI